MELGLITSAWTLTPVELTELDNESIDKENVLQTSDKTDNAVEKNRFVGYLSIMIVSIILVLILLADISLKL